MTASVGWLGGGDADDGSPRARALRFHGTRTLIALLVAAITYLVFPASPVVDSPILEVGSVAPDNVIAPFGYTVLKSPEELAKEQNDIIRSVEPIFSLVPAALWLSVAHPAAFFVALACMLAGMLSLLWLLSRFLLALWRRLRGVPAAGRVEA